MRPIATQRTIDASIEDVFAVVSDVRNFAKAVPHITDIEFLSEQHEGLGTRFRETRSMKGREASTELEVTEFVPGDRIRMVSDAGGTIWDTVFTVKPQGGKVALDMVMDVRPHKFLARLMTPLIRGMVTRAVEDDLDAVRDYCEKQRPAAG